MFFGWVGWGCPVFSSCARVLSRNNTKVRLIAWRSAVSVSRNKGAILGKVVPSLFLALVLAAIYSDVGEDQKAIQDRIGALFFFSIQQTFGNLMGVLNTFLPEKVTSNTHPGL